MVRFDHTYFIVYLSGSYSNMMCFTSVLGVSFFEKNLMDFPKVSCFTMVRKQSSSESNASVKYVCLEQRSLERIVKCMCFIDEKQ